jgi:hypothetical protein
MCLPMDSELRPSDMQDGIIQLTKLLYSQFLVVAKERMNAVTISAQNLHFAMKHCNIKPQFLF